MLLTKINGSAGRRCAITLASWLIGYAVVLVSGSTLAQDSSLIPVSPVQVEAIEKGQRAPFSGILKDHLTSARDEFHIERIEFQLSEAGKKCEDQRKADRELAEEKLKIRQEVSAIQLKFLEGVTKDATQDAIDARTRSWYEKPEFWFCFGLAVGGVAVALVR
jgi:hypothetical protein